MNIRLTNEALNDISTFYRSAMKAHPNTFGVDDAHNALDSVYNAIISQINSSCINGKEPLLKQFNDGKTVEMSISKNGKAFWYFTVRLEGDVAVVENAWHYSNASNRAYRRGEADTTAPLSSDGRKQQNPMVLKELKMKEIVQEVVRKVLSENVEMLSEGSPYVPIAHNKKLTLPNGVVTTSLVTLSDGAGRYDICEDDSSYVIYQNKNKLNNPIYICPELHMALKKLPNLPLH